MGVRKMNQWIEIAEQEFVPVYHRYPVVLERGEGVFLYDIYGKKYLDFGSGIGVCALGYHDMAYTNSLKNQIDKLLHTSNLFYNVPAIQAAKQFNEAANMEKVFFTNSGTEAIEGAIKIAKKYHYDKYNNHFGEIICNASFISWKNNGGVIHYRKRCIS